jgi:hypothetical protein
MRARRLMSLAVITACAFPMTACDDDERIELEARRRATPGISFVEATALLERGPKRVELALDAESPSRVRALEIQDDVELFQDERIVGPLASAGPLGEAACRGTLNLGLAGVDVRIDPSITRFESGETAVSCADFATRVARLAESGRPAWVMATRQPGRFARDVGETTFFAQRLRVLGAAEDDAGPRLELNVGPANLARCADAPTGVVGRCVGALSMLGQTFVITAGGTDLGTEFPSELIVVELEGLRARSVSVATGELLLTNGITVRVVDATRFAEEEGGIGLSSLEGARDALAAGAGVLVDGEAMVLAGPTVVFLADELSLVRADGLEPLTDDVLFAQGSVATVGGDSLELGDGTEVRLADGARIEGDVASFGAAADAIEAGQTFRADVLGRSTTSGSASILEAALVRFTRTSVGPVFEPL